MKVLLEFIKFNSDQRQPEASFGVEARFRLMEEDGYTTVKNAYVSDQNLEQEAAAKKIWAKILRQHPELVARCLDVEPNWDPLLPVERGDGPHPAHWQ